MKCSAPVINVISRNCCYWKVEEAEVAVTNKDLEISLHAISGWSSTWSMKIDAYIGKQWMLILVDSRSTHNFISERLTNLIHLSMISIDLFLVKVASRRSISCRGRFEQVPLETQDITFHLTFYVFLLIGLHLVLGVLWLSELDPIICDWKRMTIEFVWTSKYDSSIELTTRPYGWRQWRNWAEKCNRNTPCSLSAWPPNQNWHNPQWTRRCRSYY